MKSIVFVHSYCLSEMKFSPIRFAPYRLTPMSAEAMRIGIQTLRDRGGTDLIVSTAYATWMHEARLQKGTASAEGIPTDRIHVIPEATDSYDEALRSCAMARSLGAEKIFVIAEKWHAPRSRKAFAAAGSGLQVEIITFGSPAYERTLEPSRIKSLRAGDPFLWAAWNALLSRAPARWLQKNRS